MVVVVVLEPSGDLPQRGERIRQSVHASIVALEGFDEALGNSVRLRALDWCEAGRLAWIAKGPRSGERGREQSGTDQNR